MRCVNPKRWFCIVMLVLVGCQSWESVSERQLTADLEASKLGWHKQIINTQHFPLLAYTPDIKKADKLHIYIEGDGLAWVSRTRPSRDPTPINPVALKLALADHRHTVIYLARPCQYVSSPDCNAQFWTSARFGTEVVESSNEAISELKKQFQAEQITLIGFSGGGAVAALVAAQRDDVTELITVAGNLNPVLWTQTHQVSPLTESFNPIDYQPQLKHIKQIHFVGQGDKVMPESIARSYQHQFPIEYQPEVIVVPNMQHSCCWQTVWPELLNNLVH